MAIEAKKISKLNLAGTAYQIKHVDAADLPITAAELATLFPAGPTEIAEKPETHEEVDK